MKVVLLLFFITAGCSTRHISRTTDSDPLPSWNETAIKTSIISFVSKITNENSKDFVPTKDRVATFDNDGTLWAETPFIQGVYSEMQAKKLKLRLRPLHQMNHQEFIKFFVLSNTGSSVEAYKEQVKKFFEEVKHPKLNVPLKHTVYQPQLELMQYLVRNGFRIYICSGGGTEFMRVVSQEFYGIPEEQVIGTTFETVFNEADNILIQKPKMELFNDKIEKVSSIERVIGKRPIFAVGNVRSGGDVYMLRYSQGSQYPNFQMMINHDDGEREFFYEEKDRTSLNWAEKYNWNVVSMKKDWRKIFPEK